MNIPILNIYYLLSYAWNKLEESEITAVNETQCDTLVDLLAKVLAKGMSYILQRGIDRGYLPHCEETKTLRGKIDFSATLKRNLFSAPQVYCEYDDFNYNVLHNQILKTTLDKLIRFKDLDHTIRDELVGFYCKLREVELIHLTKQHFGLVQLHSNNAFYAFLLNICELVHDNLFISEEDGASRFRDFVRDEKNMAMLFEAFVRNFYKREQSTFTVSRENIIWDFVPLGETSADYLPKMQTDISLTSASRKIIIDTKYYTKTLQTYYDKDSIRSENLRQIHAYLTNLPLHEKSNFACEGILLYPTVREELDESYSSPGHGYQLRIASINLDQPWVDIHKALLRIIGI